MHAISNPNRRNSIPHPPTPKHFLLYFVTLFLCLMRVIRNLPRRKTVRVPGNKVCWEHWPHSNAGNVSAQAHQCSSPSGCRSAWSRSCLPPSPCNPKGSRSCCRRRLGSLRRIKQSQTVRRHLMMRPRGKKSEANYSTFPRGKEWGNSGRFSPNLEAGL